MNKKIAALAAGAAILASVLPAFAVKPNGPAAWNGVTKGNDSVYHLELYEKDSNWDPVEGGAWGKLTYNTDKMTLVFNGHMLEPDTEYSLIVYDVDDEDVNEWPGEGIVLAEGTSDADGEVHLSSEYDSHYAEAKIWLVLSDDLNANGYMNAWNPSEYLFEYTRVDL